MRKIVLPILVASIVLNLFLFWLFTVTSRSEKELMSSNDHEHAALEACRQVVVTLGDASDYQNDLLSKTVETGAIPDREELDEYGRLFSLNDAAIEAYNKAQADKETFYKNVRYMDTKIKEQQ